jgi:hypothetical protein
MAGRERIGADLVNVVAPGFLVLESLPRVLDHVGVEACSTAANSEHCLPA